MGHEKFSGVKLWDRKKEKGTGSGKGYDLISLVLSIAFKNNEDFACDWNFILISRFKWAIDFLSF